MSAVLDVLLKIGRLLSLSVHESPTAKKEENKQLKLTRHVLTFSVNAITLTRSDIFEAHVSAGI